MCLRVGFSNTLVPYQVFYGLSIKKTARQVITLTDGLTGRASRSEAPSVYGNLQACQ